MTSEKFCLRWNDFESHVSGSFREIRDSKDFFDVTLVCGEEQVQAHKVIISACSPFFRDILRRNPHQHPLLYLKGVKFTELQSVMNFMYHGEANIAQEDLNSFLSVAEELKVKGLTQSQVGGGGEASKPFKPPSKDPPPPPPKRPKMTSSHKAADDDDIQEIMPVKTEPAAARTDFYSGDQVEADTQVAEYGEETYENYEEYDTDQGYGVAPVGQNFDAKGDTLTDPEQLMEYVARDPLTGKYSCKICANFSHQWKSNTRNHVESKHFPTSFVYACDHCSATFNTRMQLYAHRSQKHRDVMAKNVKAKYESMF